MGKNARVLALFDVDGTLTEPRKVVSPETLEFLAALREKIAIGVVGGSDLVKQKEQLGDSPGLFDWCFAENGLLAHKDGTVIGQTSLVSHLGAAASRARRHMANRPPHLHRPRPLAPPQTATPLAGEEKLQRVINWILLYFANLDLPVKRGTFVEFRQGMLNVSPIGRNCSREERNEFERFDLANKVTPRWGRQVPRRAWRPLRRARHTRPCCRLCLRPTTCVASSAQSRQPPLAVDPGLYVCVCVYIYQVNPGDHH